MAQLVGQGKHQSNGSVRSCRQETGLPSPLSYEEIFFLDLIPTAFTRKAAHIRLRLRVIVSTGNPLSVNFFFEKAELDAGVKPRATTRPSQPVIESG
jgi:hypothetical protein